MEIAEIDKRLAELREELDEADDKNQIHKRDRIAKEIERLTELKETLSPS